MRTLTFLTTFSLLILALSGCVLANVEGDVHGEPLNVKSAIFFEGVMGLEDSDKSVLTVIVSDYPNLCERIIDDEADIEDFRGIVFFVFDIDNGRVEDISEKGYDILGEGDGVENGGVLAFAIENDDDCEAKEDQGESGLFDVKTYEEGELLSFDFETEFDGDDVEGDIIATFCDVDPEDVLVSDDCEE